MKPDDKAATTGSVSSDDKAAPTGDDSSDRATTGAVSVAAVTPPETLTVEAAAAMLNLSARTIQRRCQRGKLQARQVEGEFGEVWEIDRAAVETMQRQATSKSHDRPRQSSATPTTGAVSSDAAATTTGDSNASDARAIIPLADDRKRADRDDEGSDFRARYIAQMEAENSFLKSQLEDANRNAAELRASLREALRAMPKQLTAAPDDAATTHSPTTETAQERAQIVKANNVLDDHQAPHKSPPTRTPRALWKILLGIR